MTDAVPFIIILKEVKDKYVTAIPICNNFSSLICYSFKFLKLEYSKFTSSLLVYDRTDSIIKRYS